jgi:hypothetical protein
MSWIPGQTLLHRASQKQGTKWAIAQRVRVWHLRDFVAQFRYGADVLSPRDSETPFRCASDGERESACECGSKQRLALTA